MPENGSELGRDSIHAGVFMMIQICPCWKMHDYINYQEILTNRRVSEL